VNKLAKEIRIIGLTNIPLIKKGDDIAEIIIENIRKEKIIIEEGDVIVISQKIVSKAEGRIVNLRKIKPSKKAIKIAEITNKDPRLVEIILKESKKIIKACPGHLIVKTKQNIVCANAGVDRSNVAGKEDIVTLLPKNPDYSADKIRKKIEKTYDKKIGVVISDTYGRPLRNGHVNMAIGLSRIKPFKDYRGEKDIFGYKLKIKNIALADEIASAAELIMGQARERIPVVIIKGLNKKLLQKRGKTSAKDLNMPEVKWLFK
jgi:coenzyme F420-0:L-glutamate ligase/coenzyme F420-1:gamma-L-glutamate ligase